MSVGVGAFTPSNLAVTPGTVTWTWNSGGATHNVTFEDNVDNAEDRMSGSHNRGFSAPGTYRYRCDLHST
ncbi:MAG: cupredoxin domain-containing protein, partial [Acidimicrobiales bacterium]